MRKDLKHPNRRLKGAFTLIELLVVVAIIALLISILLPSLNRAKRQARQVKCLSNVRSLGEAAHLYAADNRDFLPRALQMFSGRVASEYHSFATCLPEYLGWSGNLGLQLRPQSRVDVQGDQDKLWQRNTPFPEQDWWRAVILVYASIPQYQCPDYPQGLELRDDQWDKIPDSPVDYVASAIPIPYTWENIDYDVQGGGEYDPDAEYQGETAPGYIPTSKLEDFPPGVNPADLIYVTESHITLPWKQEGCRFHHFFLTSQLPLAARPRIASDQRHPAGLCALFFDSHARTMEIHQMDPGWPNTLDKRLKYFTVMPDDWEVP